MQHFQFILIVIGLFAIGGVLIHGYILSRKEKKTTSNKQESVDIFAEELTSGSTDNLPDEDVGEVKIILNNDRHDQEYESIDFSIRHDEEPVISDLAKIENTVDDAKENVSPDYFAFETPHTEDASDFSTEDTCDEEIPVNADDLLSEEEQPQDLFIFNVVAKDGGTLGGHELLQFFLTSGFRFGDMSIFHRHQNSDGTGAILFSIANMMDPGVFEPEHMEQFKSVGVSFFLTAPNKEIDIRAAFKMMLRAVEQISEEFDCEVLNAAREPMTEDQFIEYNHRLLHYI